VSTDLKQYLLKKLREEFVVACIRAVIASVVLLSLFQWPILKYFSHDIINLSAVGALVFLLLCRLSLVWLKGIRDEVWLKIHSLLIALISCSWSVILFNVTMSPIAKTELHIFTHLVFAGLVASSAFTLSISRRDFYAFAFPIISSQTIAFAIYTSDATYRISILAIMSIFFIFLLKQRARFQDNWVKALVQNYELQKIIDAIPGGIIVIQAGVYSLINKTLNEIFQGVLDFKGKSIQDVASSREFSSLNEQIRKFLSTDSQQTQFEIELIVNEKKQTHLVNAIKINSNETIISTLDVSDRKRSEEEINMHKARLFKNAKMVMLGEMSEGLSHEINNAMATISMKSQQLELLANKSSQVSSEQIINNLAGMNLKIARVTEVVKGLRSISKGHISSPKSQTLVSDVVKSTLSLCKVKFEVAGVAIIEEIDEGLNIECVPAQISQVLLTALYNSFEAIQKNDEKWIKILTRYDEKKIQLVVQDSGKGLPEAIRDHVMTPFFTTKEMNNGTGLGLSLSKDIIEAHGGTLYFNFANTINTELVIELPIFK
jgi:signal transduction histidine kinase